LDADIAKNLLSLDLSQYIKLKLREKIADHITSYLIILFELQTFYSVE
jgi:hypothetical protein